jgi:formylglycine-generating enzyme required for sulfatase activity
MKLVGISPGEFIMGSPLSEWYQKANEGPQHKVKITRGFWMSDCEVTQAQYKKVMGRNPSRGKGDRLPVESVSWNDAMLFCKKLSSKEGTFYRLPTEAEWEYACRAGTTTTFYTGEKFSRQQANDVFGETTPVANFPPNAFGLYDMHGNVAEWCLDFYDANYYRDSPAVNPDGPKTGSEHVIRDSSIFGRSACRDGAPPDIYGSDLGFRVVLIPSAR